MSVIPSRLKPPRGAAIQWEHPLARGLVGCWLFNQPGPPIDNIALPGSLGDGTASGGLDHTNYAIGPGGHYVNLDGSGEYWNVGNTAAWNINDPPRFTVECIVRHNTSFDAIAGRQHGGNFRGWNLWVDSDTKLGAFEIQGRDNSDQGFKLTGATDWRNTGWHHVFAVINGYSMADARIWVDGKDDSGTQGTDLSAAITESVDLNIGAMRNGQTHFAGDIMLFRFWPNRALRTDEVRELTTDPYRMFEPLRHGTNLIAAAAKSSTIHAVEATVTYDPKSTTIHAVEADVTYDPKSSVIHAVEADLTYDPKTTTIHAVEADVTYDPKSATIHAVEADVTYSLQSARIHAVEASITYDPKTAVIHAVEGDITYSVKNAVIHAVEADITYSPKSATIHAAEADITYDPKSAVIHAAQADITFDPKSATIHAVEGGITYIIQGATIHAVQGTITYTGTVSTDDHPVRVPKEGRGRRVRLLVSDLNIRRIR